MTENEPISENLKYLRYFEDKAKKPESLKKNILPEIEETLLRIQRKLIDEDNKIVGEERDLVEPSDRDDFEARIRYMGELAFKAGQRSGLERAIEIIRINEFDPTKQPIENLQNIQNSDTIPK